jgi:hypothetical protein
MDAMYSLTFVQRVMVNVESKWGIPQVTSLDLFGVDENNTGIYERKT